MKRTYIKPEIIQHRMTAPVLLAASASAPQMSGGASTPTENILSKETFTFDGIDGVLGGDDLSDGIFQ